MPDWYYYENGKEIGPINGSKLKELALQGVITPDTDVKVITPEFPQGRTGPAKDIKDRQGNGLAFSASSSYQSSFQDIFAAARKGTVEDVMYFVEKKGTDVNTRDKDGGTPLHHAAANNSNLEVLQYLILKGANVNAKQNNGVTPLHAAAYNNSNVKVLEYLISQGTDVNAKINDGFTALDFANTEEKKRILR